MHVRHLYSVDKLQMQANIISQFIFIDILEIHSATPSPKATVKPVTRYLSTTIQFILGQQYKCEIVSEPIYSN
jgi:hypothetical protein